MKIEELIARLLEIWKKHPDADVYAEDPAYDLTMPINDVYASTAYDGTKEIYLTSEKDG